MNDKDKETFEKWFNKERRVFEANEPATFCDSDEFCMKNGWQAACEYKQQEIDIAWGECRIYFKMTDSMSENIVKLEAENKKLRDVLNTLRQNLKWDSGNSEIIREALKEVGE